MNRTENRAVVKKRRGKYRTWNKDGGHEKGTEEENENKTEGQR